MYIISSFFFIIGAVLLYRQLFPMATSASRNAVAKNKVFGLEGQKNRLLDAVSLWVNKLYHPTDARLRDIGKMLAASSNPLPAHTYLSRLVSKSLLWSLLGVILLIRSPLLGLLCAVYAGADFYLALQSLKEKYQAYQTEIEKDLPKLCSVINARLHSTKNIQVILASFLPIASPSMQDEINLTLADMKTGNPEIALRRMETRLSSPKVSDVVRGLISVLHGDNQAVYFQAKQHQMNNDYMMTRKKEIQQRSLKMTMPGLLAFLFFFILIVYPLMISTSDVMQQIF